MSDEFEHSEATMGQPWGGPVPETGEGWPEGDLAAEGEVAPRTTEGEDVDTSEDPGEAEAAGIPGEEPPRPSVFELCPRDLGRRGEDMAARYLDRHGWYILDRNWCTPFGEVDIVALDEDAEDDTVVLIEVKTRLATAAGADVMPELAVDEQKRQRYRMMGLHYLMAHPEITNIRFDVIAISVVGEEDAKLRHIFGAYDGGR